MPDTAIFHIEGGIGKHIASTAVVECYKKHNPGTKIIVNCAWPEVYLNNQHIERVYKLNSLPYFYEDYIYQKDVEVFAHEPYKTTDHLTKRSHIINTWCNMIGIKYNGELPNLFFNFREIELGSKLFVNPTTKPILIFQPFGGPGKEHQDTPYSWMRDIHPDVAQQLVDHLNEKYFIIHVCYDFHPVLQNVLRIDQVMQKKILFSALYQSSARLLVDSSLQHAAAAMNLPSTVVWVATQPEIFGYEMHRNVTPRVEYRKGTIDSYLFDYNFTGAIHECPYTSMHEIFNVDEILKDLL